MNTTSTATDLWRMSATELADAIRSRQASSQEVVEAHLRRIEAVNPAVNAVTLVLGEQAVEAAKAPDRVGAGAGDLPRLHGVPVTVKENIDVAGTPTTLGLKALAAAYPRRDAPVVERLKAAGAIPIGRTNLANALGLPAVALPVGIADGLPQSVQVIGPRYREDLCLDAAAAVEARLGVITPVDPR